MGRKEEAMEQFLAALDVVAKLCVCAFMVLQVSINRIASMLVKDLQEQVDELKQGGDAARHR